MKVTVVDCSVSGHREMYYKQFARTWASMGCTTSLLAPDGEEIGHDSITFHPLSMHPLRRLPVGKPLKKKLTVVLNACIRLRNLYRLRHRLKQLHPDLVFFACLDDMLPTLAPLWLFNFLLPYPWSGLLVQSDLPRHKVGMPDVRPFLKSKHCTGIGVLNEFSIKDLEAFQKNTFLFPDFTDTSSPDHTYPLLRELRQRANGRKIISSLGSIHARKGISLLQQTILLLPEEEYFFLIAGPSSLSAPQADELQELQKSRHNCLFSFQKIPNEGCFNALVAESSLIFAAYRQFTGSSNLLTKAAIFQKPVVVSRGFCMGKRVEAYKTGKAIEEDATEECCHAIRQLCTEADIDSQAFAAYAHDHHIEKLTTCFNRISQLIR